MSEGYEYNEGSRVIYKRLASEDRFSNYRELVSRYAGTGACGHAISKGDVIGWNKRHGSRCKDCWAKWVGENAAADFDERMMGGGY